MKKLITLLRPVILLLGGGATADKCNVSLVNVQFTGATVLETTATFTVRVNHETSGPLVLDGAVHKIYLEGLSVGEGLSHEKLEVPRLSSVTQHITVHLSNLRLATRIKPIIESKAFDYKVRSIIYPQSPDGKFRVASEGRLDLRDFQPTPK